jgi:biopolymer transport protein ExbD
MRRFSQRTHLVTLSEINITPLLDLAFVLLIIFVITTPLLQQGVDLPTGGKPDRPLTKNDFRTLELVKRNSYRYQGQAVNFTQLGQLLARERQLNPTTVIFIMADQAAPFQEVFEVTDTCAKLGLGVSFRSNPPKAR